MLSRFSQNFSQTLAVSVLAVLCVLAVGALQVPQLKKLTNGAKTAPPAELQREVKSEKEHLNLLQKLPAFGFDNWLADWVFIDFIQYFGDDDARDITGYGISPDYFEVIITHDPRFVEAYHFLSTSATVYAGMPEKSIALMEKGLKSLSPKVPPQSYVVWVQKGIDELLFLGNAESAKQSFEKAAEWVSVYPDAHSQKLAKFYRANANSLAHNPRSKIAQINTWLMVLTSATDNRTRQIAINRIQGLGGKISRTSSGNLQIKIPKQD